MDHIFISNRIVRPKKYSYDVWWNAPVESVSDKNWSSKYGPVTHGQYVRDFYYSLQSILNNTGYTITNEKEFKNEIATLIYRLSDDHL
jgi:hypothetical protein